MKNGWHKIYNREVYIEDDKILRGTKGNKTAYPYRYIPGAGYRIECNITVNAFRAAVKRGTVELF